MLPFGAPGTVDGHENCENNTFQDATCLMWAVLALARLNEIVPPFDVAFELDRNRGGAWAFRLRNALDDTIKSFCDVDMKDTWSTLYADRAFQIVSNLDWTATEYWRLAENTHGSEYEFLHLCKIFHHFYRSITLGATDYEEPFGSLGMLTAVSIRMHEIASSDVTDTIIEFMRFVNGELSPHDIDSYLEERLGVICAVIERFFREQKELKAMSNYDPEGVIGNNFVEMIREPLRNHVGLLLQKLALDLYPIGSVVDLETHIEDVLFEFYAGIARFFSYASPLLSDYFIPDITSDEENEEGNYEMEIVPEHVTNHDFSRYEDADWFSGQFALFDAQDVLHGPEHAELDEVSIVATPSTDCSCFICGDDDTKMRKLKVCGHGMCETCLVSQLRVEHECRYRCAFCRAEFFSQV